MPTKAKRPDAAPPVDLFAEQLWWRREYRRICAMPPLMTAREFDAHFARTATIKPMRNIEPEER